MRKGEFDVFIVPLRRMARRCYWSEQETTDRIYECLTGKELFLCSLPKDMLRNLASKIEKVPRGIRGEKSSKTWQVRGIWSQQLEH